MFGERSINNPFGQPTGFGSSATSPFGSVGLNSQQCSPFGQTTRQSLFAMNRANSIFASSNAQATTSGTASFFGNDNQSKTPSIFGNNDNNRLDSRTFSLGQPKNVSTGTTLKYTASISTDVHAHLDQDLDPKMRSWQKSARVRSNCITCMREYESKSLEELRFEDYNDNRKGKQQSSPSITDDSLFGKTSSTNPFGASTSTGSLFGKQNTTTIGFITPSAATTSFFDSNQTSDKPGFFKSQPQHQSTVTQTTIGGTPLQNQPQQSPLFFKNLSTFQPSSSNTSFINSNISTTTQQPLFGTSQATPQAGSFFGSLAPNRNFLSNFGSSPTPFGTQPQPTSGFGRTTPITGNVFDAQPSLFSTSSAQNAAPSFSTFGDFGTTSNLFGTATNAIGTTSGSNPFGTQSNSSVLNFNKATSQSFQSSALSSQFIQPTFAVANAVVNSNLNLSPSANTDQIIARLQTFPYGSPQFLTEYSSSSDKTEFTASPKICGNAKSQADVRMQRVPRSTEKPTTLIFDGLEDESPENLKCAKDIMFFTPTNIKKLVLNKRISLFKSPSIQSSPPTVNKSEIASSSKVNCSP